MRFTQKIVCFLLVYSISTLSYGGIITSYGGSWSANFEIDFPDVPTPANFTASYSGDFVNDVLLGPGFNVGLVEEVPLNEFGDFAGGDVNANMQGDVGPASVSYQSSQSAGPGLWAGSPEQRVTGSLIWDWTFGVEDSAVDFAARLFGTTGKSAFQLVDLSTDTIILENSIDGLASPAVSEAITLNPGTIYRFMAETSRDRIGGGDGVAADTSFVLENVDGFAVPAPAPLGLLLMGMVALGLIRHRTT